MIARIVAHILATTLALAGTASGGSAVLSPADYANISASQECAEAGFAVSFDFSGIPAGATIDLAELMLTISTDTTLSQKVFIGAMLATSQWESDQVVSLSDIDASDSLAVGCYTDTGEDVVIEMNITPLANLWHSGAVPNRGLVVKVYGIEGAGLSVAATGGQIQASLHLSYTRAD